MTSVDDRDARSYPGPASGYRLVRPMVANFVRKLNLGCSNNE
jgi:hypothetical protein